MMLYGKMGIGMMELQNSIPYSTFPDLSPKIQQKEQIDTEISRMSFENHTEDKADYKTETTSVKDKFDELW